MPTFKTVVDHLLGRGAWRADSVVEARRHVRLALDAAEFEQALTMLAPFEAALMGRLDVADSRLIERVRERAQLIDWVNEAASPRSGVFAERRVINLLAYSLPHTQNGFGLRSHGVAKSILAAGWEVQAWTVPGFPADQIAHADSEEIPAQDDIEGVCYRRLFEPRRRGRSEFAYLSACIEVYRQLFERERPAIVHAAVGYVTGVPALVAARRSGIPFVLELRGFWEVMRASREPAFGESPAWRHMRRFRNLLAASADHVLTLTEGMREDLIAAGVAGERISVAPNCVDAIQFRPHVADRGLAAQLRLREGVPVVGYVGSMLDYEGLDDLLTALAGLAGQGLEFTALFVGDGPQLGALRIQAEATGMADRCRFLGRVAHADVERFYSLIDICPFPRKPWEVCQLVSPLKPLEAMAQQKAVVVSDVAALREMIVDGQTGIHVTAGDVTALERGLFRLLTDGHLREQLGRQARQWALQFRPWRVVGEICDDAYRQLIANEKPLQNLDQ